ncbi:hypothetical protein BT63DRAFT_481566 [Microthyrium microscopicum]|uniref:Utp8 beta-propeller domain-containing protein n=1 Tax=Microthyrium microscopicum TaxID=703497 RepID=A0A6A6U749_9PEZI|nr:hypothetical protein BT63DRAFT_481566 [Microthyrium microscopicum]
MSTIESVYSLLTLPKPFDSDNGRIQAAPVTSFTQSRKRKRSHVSVAVDGDSLNTYHIQPPSLIYSHAVSPQIRFLSKPCSVISNPEKSKATLQRSYVVAQDTSTDESIILCFEDAKNGPDTAATKFQTEISLQSSVLSLEAVHTSLPAKTHSSFEILLIQRNGTAQLFSSDLSQLIWTASLEPSNGAEQFDNAICIDAKTVKDTFFENREDLAGQLVGIVGGSEANLSRATIICSVGHDVDRTNLQISLSVIRPNTRVANNFEHPLQHLITLTTPIPSHGDPKELVSCSWNVICRLLHVKLNTKVYTYSFGKGVPELISTIETQDSDGHLALDGSLYLVGSDSAFTIYDSKYSSVQDRHLLPSNFLTLGKKRKRVDAPVLHSCTQLLHFSPKLGMAILLHENELLGIQFNARASHKRRKMKSSKLLNSLNRGVPNGAVKANITIPTDITESLGQPFTDQESHGWTAKREHLIEVSNKGDTEAFERELATDPGFSWLNQVDSDASLLQWSFDKPVGAEEFSGTKLRALFILRVIFELGEPDKKSEQTPRIGGSPPLTIRFFPPNIFLWLASRGHLSNTMIEQALRLYPQDEPIFSLQPSDVITAVARFDPSLGVLCSMITHHPYLPIDDLAQCIKHIVQSYDNSNLPAPKALLTNGDEHLPNGDDESDLDQQVEDALDDVDMALDALEEHHPMRGEALSRALTALNGHGGPAITNALRSALTQHELIFLVHILRIELAEGGWTSRYVDSTSADEEKGPFDHSITVVARLLSCTVDAIGITGWLTTSATNPIDAVDDLLAQLRAEISAALEGTHEANFMCGMLGEFLRFGNRLATSSKTNKKHITKGLQELPIGLKMDEIEDKKIGPDGKAVKRSLREIRRQMQLRVPAYITERIRVK